MADFDIHGLEPVLETMKWLPLSLRRKGARAAGRKAANVVRDAARAGWAKVDRPSTPLRIADNVAVQFASRHFRKTGDIMFRVGIRGGAKAYGNTKQNRGMGRVGKKYSTGDSTYYWRLYELGTSRQPARPVMVPAMERNVERATDVFVAQLGRELDKLLKKGR